MRTVSEATWLRKQNCNVTIRMKECPVTIIRFKKSGNMARFFNPERHQWQHGLFLEAKANDKLDPCHTYIDIVIVT